MIQDDLYQARILEHARRPQALPAGAERRATVDNPFCGDVVTVGVHLDERGRIEVAGSEGEGCAVAKASASMMLDAVLGRDAAAVEDLYARLLRLLAGEPHEGLGLGDLDSLAGVARYPSRKRCATLAWEALRAALR